MGKKKGIDWDKVEDLGQVPDRVIAERFGCSITSVYTARINKNVSSFTKHRPNHYVNWDETVDFGKVPDEVIAQRLGCHRTSVSDARRKRGIPSFKATNSWDKVENLGKIPDAEIAAQRNCSLSAVTSARWKRRISDCVYINWDLVLDLGKTWDYVIAQRLGCNRDTVANRRNILKIPPYKEERICPCGTPFITKRSDSNFCSDLCRHKHVHAKNLFSIDSSEELPVEIYRAYRKTIDYLGSSSARKKNIEWDNVSDLGLVSDGVIAARLGCAKSSVAGARRTRGIPKYIPA